MTSENQTRPLEYKIGEYVSGTFDWVSNFYFEIDNYQAKLQIGYKTHPNDPVDDFDLASWTLMKIEKRGDDCFFVFPDSGTVGSNVMVKDVRDLQAPDFLPGVIVNQRKLQFIGSDDVRILKQGIEPPVDLIIDENVLFRMKITTSGFREIQIEY